MATSEIFYAVRHGGHASGAYVCRADSDEDAIERAKARLGPNVPWIAIEKVTRTIEPLYDSREQPNG